MRIPSRTTWPLLAVLCLSVAACGSVATRSGTGGSSGSDAATGGSGAGGSGTGGSGSGGAAVGGMTGSMGGAGGAQADAGSGDAGSSDGPGIRARGGITPFGVLAPASGATVRVVRQRFGPTFVCNTSTCFSGGLLPP